MVEMSSLNVVLAPRDRFHRDVHTFVHSALMNHMFSHKIAIVLSGPPTGTCGFSRDHDNCVFSRNVAYSTWSIVVAATRHQRSFILCPIHKAMSTYSRLEWQSVLWVIWHAQVIGCSSEKVTSSSSIHTLRSTATVRVPPPVVCDSSHAGSRGSWRST